MVTGCTVQGRRGENKVELGRRGEQTAAYQGQGTECSDPFRNSVPFSNGPGQWVTTATVCDGEVRGALQALKDTSLDTKKGADVVRSISDCENQDEHERLEHWTWPDADMIIQCGEGTEDDELLR